MMSTRALASAVPVMVAPAANALALMTLMSLMSFPLNTFKPVTFGATVSIVIPRSPPALVLPAKSVCVALRLSPPWFMAVMSSGTKV